MTNPDEHTTRNEPDGAERAEDEGVIQGPRDIRDAYRDQDVAEHYVDRRFAHPLGQLLHDRQAKALRRIANRYKPDSVLEIAPGPGRLTVETAQFLPRGGIVMDASRQMLEVAGRRLEEIHARDRWRLVLGDAFELPFANSGFDLIYSFRFIRHFRSAERSRLLAAIAPLLRPDGILVFDAVNQVVSKPLRENAAPGEYRHFDALMTKPQIRQELEAASLELLGLEGIQRRYGLLHRVQVLVGPRSRVLARLIMELMDRLGGGEALEWLVTCRRA